MAGTVVVTFCFFTHIDITAAAAAAVLLVEIIVVDSHSTHSA